MSGALIRYRVIAYLVGVVLLLLTAGVVLRYGFGHPQLSETVSPIHGFLYMVYLVAVFDLGRRVGWPLARMGWVMLAGTVPLLSFYAERRVTRALVSARRPVDPGGGRPAGSEEIDAGSGLPEPDRS